VEQLRHKLIIQAADYRLESFDILSFDGLILFEQDKGILHINSLLDLHPYLINDGVKQIARKYSFLSRLNLKPPLRLQKDNIPQRLTILPFPKQSIHKYQYTLICNLISIHRLLLVEVIVAIDMGKLTVEDGNEDIGVHLVDEVDFVRLYYGFVVEITPVQISCV
jgi:hypothetical protein